MSKKTIPTKILVDSDNCLVRYIPCWIPLSRSHELLHIFEETLPLAQKENIFFGRKVRQPRLTSWHADGNKSYTYSGVERKASPWTPELLAIKQDLNTLLGVEFNSVLVNYYRDGKDSIGVHSDDETGLGPTKDNVVIASVSFGDPREFILTHKTKGTVIKRGLGCGDLLTMEGKTQQFWKHEIPKTNYPVGPRLNLTYRVVNV